MVPRIPQNQHFDKADVTVSSRQWSITGHHTIDLAGAFILIIPTCSSCNSDNTSLRKDSGIITPLLQTTQPMFTDNSKRLTKNDRYSFGTCVGQPRHDTLRYLFHNSLKHGWCTCCPSSPNATPFCYVTTKTAAAIYTGCHSQQPSLFRLSSQQLRAVVLRTTGGAQPRWERSAKTRYPIQGHSPLLFFVFFSFLSRRRANASDYATSKT